MTDFTKMSGTELLTECRDDARKWAQACRQNGWQLGLDLDLDWLTVWFANAIENSCDVRSGRGPTAISEISTERH
jgi:hypothetical protein